MPSKHFLNNASIPAPCNADWNAMKGNDQIRFCEHCNLSVHNLSQMTRSQAERLINKSKGRLCVRYDLDPAGLPRTLPLTRTVRRIRRRVSRLAAGAFSATLTVTSAAAQNSVTFHSDGPVPASQSRQTWNNSATLLGKITDQNGAVIAGATIYLSNTDLHVSLYTSTNYDGEFRVEALQPGSYQVRIEAPGFGPNVSGVYLQNNGEARLDRSLSVASLEETVEVNSTEVGSMGGVLAMSPPKDPFIRAAQEDDLEKVTELISGTDVNRRDEDTHTTALEHAVKNANREMVQLLLAAGADVNAKNFSGETVLMMIDSDATSDLVWDLINAGADVHLKDTSGNTALMQAADADNVDAVRTLLDAGAEIDVANNQGSTALMMAASSGNVNVVRALVLAGANINSLDEDGKNALALALENGHVVVVRLLKSKGAMETVALKEKE